MVVSSGSSPIREVSSLSSRSQLLLRLARSGSQANTPDRHLPRGDPIPGRRRHGDLIHIGDMRHGTAGLGLTSVRHGRTSWPRSVASRGDDVRVRIVSRISAVFLLATLALTPAKAEVERETSACTITGTQGDDRLRGTSGSDVICGRSGDDKLVGLGGDDGLRGGEGADRLFGGPGDDTLSGDDGRDIGSGGAGHDRLSLGQGGDVGVSGSAADRVDGGSGNDNLEGIGRNGGPDIV